MGDGGAGTQASGPRQMPGQYGGVARAGSSREGGNGANGIIGFSW